MGLLKKVILLVALGFNVHCYSQPNFHPDDRNWSHYVLILDKTGSMDGGAALGSNLKTPNIWQPTINNLCETIDNLNNGNNIISVYLFAKELEVLKVDGQEIKQLKISDDLKFKITNQLRKEKPTGLKTHIYNSFKGVMNDLTANNNAVINEYIHSIHLFTDGDDNSGSTCEEVNPFSSFCALKLNNDYAEIISLNQDGLNDKILACIPSNCIATPAPDVCRVWRKNFIQPKTNMTFDVQENRSVQQEWQGQIADQDLKNKKVNIKITSGPYLKGYEDVACYFVDNNNNKVTEFSALDHELRLYVDKENLNEGRNGEYVGSFSYAKTIFKDEENCKQIDIQLPTINFTYSQDSVWIGTLDFSKTVNVSK